MVVLGLCLVLYSYTLHYNPTVRVAGAAILNMGLLLEIFTVAGWNGGVI